MVSFHGKKPSIKHERKYIRNSDSPLSLSVRKHAPSAQHSLPSRVCARFVTVSKFPLAAQNKASSEFNFQLISHFLDLPLIKFNQIWIMLILSRQRIEV